jgi:hypothetical protein
LRYPIFLLSLCFLLFIILAVSCNPKPDVLEKEEGEGQQGLHSLSSIEKLTGMMPIFDESTPLFQGIERLSAYYGISVTVEDKEKIFVDRKSGYVSTIDLLNLIRAKGLGLLPVYGNSQQIMDQIKKGNPVLAQFISVGTTETVGIFYGFTDQKLLYYHLPTMKEREIPIERLSQLSSSKELTCYIPLKDINLYETELKQSEYYYSLLGREAYFKNDPEVYKIIVNRIEKEGGKIESHPQRFLYATYYIFIEPQPEKVKWLIPKLLEENDLPTTLELGYMAYVKLGEQEKADEVLDSMVLSKEQNGIYREITLYTIGTRLLEKGEFGLAQVVLTSLQERNPDYPGLEEALQKAMK